MTVCIVEHRQATADESDFVSSVAHVASTYDRAVTWIKANTNYDHKDGQLWWFVVCEETVDATSPLDCALLAAYDWDGNQIQKISRSQIAVSA